MRALPNELIVFLLLLFVLPANLVVPGFGAAGAPASLVGLLMFGFVVLGWALPQYGVENGVVAHPATMRVNPVAVALSVYVTMIVAAWTSGKLRPLSTLAGSTSDRALITIASLVGVTLFVMSRVRGEAMIISLVDVMLLGAAWMCAIGLIQFFFRVDLTDVFRLPGLMSLSPEGRGIATRSIFNRPRGSALHPIEFGVVAAAMAPIAYWRARSRGRWHWVVLAMLALSTMASLSRSAVLGFAVGGIVLFLWGSWKERATMAAYAMVFVVAAGSVIPGLVGTLRSLFSGTDHDPSIQARLDRTSDVLRLVTDHLWFGRGFGTFTPEEYLLLDNEIQKMAIETGVFGVAVFFLFVLAIQATATHTELHRVGTQTEGLSIALAASLLGLAVSYYTFDAFYYHILTGVFFLNVALIGALWMARDNRVTTSGQQ